MSRRSDIIGVTDCTGNYFKSSAVTATATATKIPTTNIDNRKAMTLLNYSDNWIFIGGSDVTTANGYPVQPYLGLPLDLGSGSNLYAICNTGETADIRILEIDNS